MPKATFFNLSKEKADRIIEIAIEEFKEHSYENASINRIVEGAEISKGSFYQYFEDKKDLYKYILEKAEKKRNKYLLDSIKEENYLSFFDSLEKLFVAEAKFAIEQPELSMIVLDFIKNSDITFKKEILEDGLCTNRIFKELLLEGIDNKDIDEDIDIELNIFFLASIYASVLEYHVYRVNFDCEKTIKYINNIIKFLKNGAKSKKKSIRNIEDRFY